MVLLSMFSVSAISGVTVMVFSPICSRDISGCLSSGFGASENVVVESSSIVDISVIPALLLTGDSLIFVGEEVLFTS